MLSFDFSIDRYVVFGSSVDIPETDTFVSDEPLYVVFFVDFGSLLDFSSACTDDSMNVVGCIVGREVLFVDSTLASVTSSTVFGGVLGLFDEVDGEFLVNLVGTAEFEVVVFADVFLETEVNDVLVENMGDFFEDDSFELSVNINAFDVLISDGAF